MVMRTGKTGVVPEENQRAGINTFHLLPALPWYLRQGVFLFEVFYILVPLPRGFCYTLYPTSWSQITRASMMSLQNATGFHQSHAPLRQITLAYVPAIPWPSILSTRILSLSTQVSPHGWADLWDAPAGERNVHIKMLQISLKTHWLLPINLCP